MKLTSQAKKWGQLLLGFVLLGFCIPFAKELRNASTPLQQIHQEIEAQGLEADALFYSESPKAVESGFILQQKTR